MLTPQQLELLQRYHDNECSPPEQAEVEALLERSPDALDALARLDNLSELYQLHDQSVLARTSFDGLWSNVQHAIAQDAAQASAAAAAAKAPAEPQRGLFAWLADLFAGHRTAWLTAAATAAAVALVFIALKPGEHATVETVVEKHYIYIDSVNKADPQSTVVINSLQDEGSAVIWLLPNAADGEEQDQRSGANPQAPHAEDEEAESDDDVIIEMEPL